MLDVDGLPDFRPGTGTPIPGVPSGSDPAHHFLANIAVGQLLVVAPDPRLAESPRLHQLDPRLKDVAQLRGEVQRLFVAAKKRNLPSYADYASELATNTSAMGILPPIKLYWPDQLELARSGGQAVLIVPFRTGLVAIDGETQLAAWHEAARRDTDVMGYHVDLTIDHGRPLEWARQGFHDLNVYGIKPNPTLAIFMDYRDPMNRIAKDLAEKYFDDRVETQQRQVKVQSDKIFTMAALRLLVICYFGGTAAIAYATRSMSPRDIGDLERGVNQWVESLLGNLPGDGFFSRDSIFTVPPMLAALGAAGHEGIDPSWLRDVEWKRDAVLKDGDLVWESIAGKRSRKPTPDERGEEHYRLAVGGPKEYVHSCFRALTDPSSPEFQRVRSQFLK